MDAGRGDVTAAAPAPADAGHRSAPRPHGLAPIVTIAAVAIGAVTAARHAWVCDDAFISFRYAAHLVHGLGLVFNPGEHVEGFTNLLWTLWMAAGLRLGADAEGWSVAWGVVCYGATIAVLGWHARGMTMLTCNSDLGFFSAGAQRTVAALREGIGAVQASDGKAGGGIHV